MYTATEGPWVFHGMIWPTRPANSRLLSLRFGSTLVGLRRLVLLMTRFWTALVPSGVGAVEGVGGSATLAAPLPPSPACSLCVYFGLAPLIRRGTCALRGFDCSRCSDRRESAGHVHPHLAPMPFYPQCPAAWRAMARLEARKRTPWTWRMTVPRRCLTLRFLRPLAPAMPRWHRSIS